MLSRYPGKVIDERQCPWRVRRAAAIRLAVQADKTAGNGDTGRGALSGNSVIRCASRDVDTDRRRVDAIHDDAFAESSRQSSVITELHFVDDRVGKRGLQRNHAVLRPGPDLQHAAADALRLGIGTQIAEETRIEGVFFIQPEIQADSNGILVDDVIGLQLINVEVGIGGSARQDEAPEEHGMHR